MTRTHPEQQYLDLLAQVLDQGDERLNSTGVGTRSVFGAMIRFDLSDGRVPILTTKRVCWETAVKEMLWCLTGDTNIRSLLREDVRTWTDRPLAAFRRETGEKISQSDFEARIVADDDFAARWGELGPVYGRQWRRWLGADGREHDQIAELVEALRTNPASHRMLFHGWNVGELDGMVLPPRHMVYQYHVTWEGHLDCLLFQRSVDLLLEAPSDYTGASALLLMLAQQSGLSPGKLVWVAGDAHLHLNHLDQARVQLSRKPRAFPEMRINREATSIDGYWIEDFQVIGYDPHPPITSDVAV